MKTDLQEMVLGAGLLSLLLWAGCDQQSAEAQEVVAKAEATPPVVAAADELKPADQKPADTKPAEPAATQPAPPQVPAGPPGTTDTNLAQNPVAFDQSRLTPALADVIKLVQSGVGEEVLMTYITNSTDIFNIGPNEILYLHDLGVPGPIITLLIQQESTPEAMSRKQAANAVQPLPPGVALNKPAANVFPPRTGAVPTPTPGLEAAVAVTNEPPADASPAPAVVYTVPTEVQQPVNVSYFYMELAPYGTWVDYPGYGRCWRPTVSVWNSSWRPYCDGGRWLWTDCGWYWYSDYSWGASVFHYGRWACPAGYGWVWVPGIHWGPAWVHWRATASHCGWTPAWPEHLHQTRHRGDADFVFVPKARLAERRLRDSLVSPTHAATLAKEANPVERPGLAMLPPATRDRIAPVSLRAGEPTVIRNSRREQLENNGRTLTVTPPAPAVPANASSTRSITSLSGHRIASERQPGTTGPQTSTANAAANNLGPNGTPATPSGPTVIPSGRAAAQIIMRGNGRASGASSATSMVGQPVTGQPATTPGSANKSVANQAAEQRGALPGGRRSVPEPVVAKLAPSSPAAVPLPGRTTVARTEPRVIFQPALQRAPGPAPVQARVAPPAAPGSGPVFRTTQSAPAAPSVSPRVESYRAPSPAPAPRVAAPVQSSGGSRSSGDTGGGQRGSR